MDNDKKIVFSIMNQLFSDDDTFSKSPKNFAMIGIKTISPSSFTEEIEFKLISKEVFYKEYMNQQWIFDDITTGFTPVIKYPTDLYEVAKTISQKRS